MLGRCAITVRARLCLDPYADVDMDGAGGGGDDSMAPGGTLQPYDLEDFSAYGNMDAEEAAQQAQAQAASDSSDSSDSDGEAPTRLATLSGLPRQPFRRQSLLVLDQGIRWRKSNMALAHSGVMPQEGDEDTTAAEPAAAGGAAGHSREPRRIGRVVVVDKFVDFQVDNLHLSISHRQYRMLQELASLPRGQSDAPPSKESEVSTPGVTSPSDADATELTAESAESTGAEEGGDGEQPGWLGWAWNAIVGEEDEEVSDDGTDGEPEGKTHTRAAQPTLHRSHHASLQLLSTSSLLSVAPSTAHR